MRTKSGNGPGQRFQRPIFKTSSQFSTRFSNESVDSISNLSCFAQGQINNATFQYICNPRDRCLNIEPKWDRFLDQGSQKHSRFWSGCQKMRSWVDAILRQIIIARNRLDQHIFQCKETKAMKKRHINVVICFALSTAYIILFPCLFPNMWYVRVFDFQSYVRFDDTFLALLAKSMKKLLVKNVISGFGFVSERTRSLRS